MADLRFKKEISDDRRLYLGYIYINNVSRCVSAGACFDYRLQWKGENFEELNCRLSYDYETASSGMGEAVVFKIIGFEFQT